MCALASNNTVWHSNDLFTDNWQKSLSPISKHLYRIIYWQGVTKAEGNLIRCYVLVYILRISISKRQASHNKLTLHPAFDSDRVWLVLIFPRSKHHGTQSVR